MSEERRGRITLAALALCVAVVAAGCAPRKGGVLNVIPRANQYEVTYRYTLAKPPPSGEVYVFWLVNVDNGTTQRMGTIQPGVNKTVRVTVPFSPTGAIVSPEKDPNAAEPGNDWELMDGRVTRAEAVTPGPTPAGSAP